MALVYIKQVSLKHFILQLSITHANSPSQEKRWERKENRLFLKHMLIQSLVLMTKIIFIMKISVTLIMLCFAFLSERGADRYLFSLFSENSERRNDI